MGGKVCHHPIRKLRHGLHVPTLWGISESLACDCGGRGPYRLQPGAWQRRPLPTEHLEEAHFGFGILSPRHRRSRR